MELEKAFEQFVNREKLFNPQQRLLVAVSGGLDSTVLCALLRAGGYHFEMAHFNFRLRGSESERDQLFLEKLAAAWEIPLHLDAADTMAIHAETGGSLQDLARRLRYEWLENLRSRESGKPFDCILTAHHAGDDAETLLLQLFRGAGLSGLSGIPLRRGRLRRPLLFATRAQLEAYAIARQLAWVEDSSNQTDKYNRNFIRNLLLPLVTEKIPGAAAGLAQSADRLKSVKSFYDAAMAKALQKLVLTEGETQKVPVLRLQQAEGGKALLYEWLHPFGFSASQVTEAWSLCHSQTGSFVETQQYRLLRNRNWLVLVPRKPAAGIQLLTTETGRLEISGALLEWETRDYSGAAVPQGQSTVWLDAAAIRYPLLLRTWKAGDYFYPLGMPKKKKIARFLTDIRVPRHEKEKCLVLETDKKICWVAGHRIDHRFRITEKTKKILVLKISSAPGSGG